MRHAFVTGWPISHSKSPVLHGYWLEKYNIQGSYDAVGVQPEAFPDFLNQLPESRFVGGNITLPHKEVAYSSIANRDQAAEMIGAINTVWVEDGQLKGSNTDAYGFSANLDDFAGSWRDGKIATVIGAGGASRAIIFALIEAGYQQIRIANRTLSRAEGLMQHFGDKCSAHGWPEIEELCHDTDLLVNTSSVGMAGDDTTSLPNLDALPEKALVTDIVYTPLVTPILKRADDRGLKTVDGLGMLLHQAVPGFEKWFGVKPEVTPALREKILGAT